MLLHIMFVHILFPILALTAIVAAFAWVASR